MGKAYPSRITLDLKGLTAGEIGVELIVATGTDQPRFVAKYDFYVEKQTDNLAHYLLELTLKNQAVNYGLRIYAKTVPCPIARTSGYLNGFNLFNYNLLYRSLLRRPSLYLGDTFSCSPVLSSTIPPLALM